MCINIWVILARGGEEATNRILHRVVQFVMVEKVPAERSAPVTVTFELAGRTIHLERFEPPELGSHPAVLFLHGADGLPGRVMPYRTLAARFAAHGYVAFLLHYYDVTDGHSRPNPLNPLNFAAWMRAVSEAIGFCLRQPGVAGGRVGLVGISLGGYLSTAVASQDGRVGAVVECCGGAADFFIRGVETMPPVLILHGGADPVVPVSEAHKLERFLKEKGRPHEVWIYPGRCHQLTGADLDDAFRRSVSFLGRYVTGERSAAKTGS
jgi:dienelactone hydrolase